MFTRSMVLMSPNSWSKADIAAKQKELLELEHALKMKEGLPHLFGFPWYKWAREAFDSQNKEIFLCAANQISKAQLFSQIIMTPEGQKILGDLKIGDYVFDKSGEPVRVQGIPYEGIDHCFEITFNDGSKTIASKDHQWICKGYRQRFRKFYASKRSIKKMANVEYDKWILKSTQQIFEDGDYSGKGYATKRFSVPICAPIQYPKKELFDPYYVGLWIGNGSETAISINADDLAIVEHCEHYGNRRKLSDGRYCISIGVRKDIFDEMSALGLRSGSLNKNIPRAYLNGSIHQRKDLLAGLMDTDGTICKDGKAMSYTTISKALADDVVELVCSLGGIAEIVLRKAGYKKDGKFIKCNDAYSIAIWLEFNPFRSPRKATRWRPNIRYKMERVIHSIKPLGKMHCRCISVEGDGSYLYGREYGVTHNSSTMIRKSIHWATAVDMWPKLWPGLFQGMKPNLFWYLYPTLQVATTEFETKWVPQFLPRGEYKNHPQYGWKENYDKKYIDSIDFNSGVKLQFKTYAMKVKDLQTASVYFCAADEEMPVEYLPEIKARLNATDGYFMMVFTATLGQNYWRQTMEPINKDEEKHKDALKFQVSLYQSQKYMDGTPSPWTPAKIKAAEANCPTEAEIQRRIYGRFIKAHGLRFESFSLEHNLSDKHPLPATWSVYGAVDPGTGGQSGHPAAILFLAVSPDCKQGRFFRAWRGDGIPTSGGDILDKYRELKRGLNMTQSIYDHAAKDFYLVASASGEAFIPADKARESGIGLLNTLFKNKMLSVQKGDPELDKLVQEFCSLPVDINKRIALDDLSDCARYLVKAVAWDFSGIVGASIQEDLTKEQAPVVLPSEVELRRRWTLGLDQDEVDPMDAEFDFWNDLSGVSDNG